ncbi:MAG: NAD(P)/FAD-dependent oxidoreductase [Oscillospiraceae bacterium]|nr:NAD(P)/FAD-dependent oxidoreductase [Oscillospiraceae bacterium]
MSLILQNIKTKVGASKDEIISSAIMLFGIKKSDVKSAGIYKISVDARKRDDIHFVSSVSVTLSNEGLEKSVAKRNKNARFHEETKINPTVSTNKKSGRVVVAGFGPAGMFCALLLSEYGYNPIVLERGDEVDARVKKVESFFAGGELDTETNVQFGEGGAGTFSDGKLMTRISDPLCRYILNRLVELGAPEEIMFEAKPHIGTDKLRSVVKAIRQRIIQNGGEIRFLTKLEEINLVNNEIKSVTASNNDIETSALVLAVGHSARDTFEMLLNKGVIMEPKAFSVGARIEHKQASIDKSLYGDLADSLSLPKGEYQLSHRRPDGRAVYTFCMCPGGTVVAAASERNTVVTNGMSEYLRDGENANAALVVSVSKEDFGSGVLDGVDFARSLERRAYSLSGGYKAPATTVGTFLEGKTQGASVIPSYRPGVTETDLNKLFPDFVSDMMREGLRKFSRQMACYGDMGAVLTAPETRTSSPVRITRGENLTALGISNLYPCGEGAGYAGGIVSAAVDGIKVAIKIIESIAPNNG